MMRLGLFAAGILSLTVTSAWAFSQQIVSPDGGNYQFTDPDQKITPDTNNSTKARNRSVRVVRRCSSVSSRAR